MIFINYKFLKYSLNTGGMKMSINHLVLRIFEMVVASTGIFVSFFELILLCLRNNKKIKHLNDI